MTLIHHIYNFLRILQRKYLAICTNITIHKHKPDIYVVIDDTYPSLIREYTYGILHSFTNCRRNIEKTINEFSIPLTVLGINNYPKNKYEWIKTNIKILLLLIKLKPYKHTIVIEISLNNKDLNKFWSNLLIDKYLITTNSALIKDLKIKENTKIIKINEDDVLNITEGKHNSLVETLLKINNQQYKNIKIIIPKTKIRILKGINNNVVIDSRFLYYPTNIKLIEDITEHLPKNKIYLTDKNYPHLDTNKSVNVIYYKNFDISKFKNYTLIIYGDFNNLEDISEVVANI